MYRRLLVPLDGSDLAEEAIPAAVMLAVDDATEIHLVHVLEELPDYAMKMPQDDVTWQERGSRAASDYLDARAGDLAARGVATVETEVIRSRRGRAAEGLDRYREERGIDLVVMTTHGEGGFRRWWLGSVADELLRRTRVPLLLLRPEEPEDEDAAGGGAEPAQPFRRVLLPLDGSPEAERIVEHAVRMARTFGAQLVLLQVVAPGLGLGRFRADPAAAERAGLTEKAGEAAREYLQGVAEEIWRRAGQDVVIEIEVVGEEHPAEGILERAQTADLVALATHGRGGFTRMVVGSVADKVLRGGRTPLLIVRASDE